MTHDIHITPNISPGQKSHLDQLVTNLDWLLDNPMGTPKPIAQTGILEQIGLALWETTSLRD